MVDLGREPVGWPDVVATRLQTLQVVNGAVAFIDGAVREPGFLKLAVHIAGEHRPAVGLGLSPVFEDAEPGMGLGVAVEIEAVAVEAPGELGVAFKSRWTGYAGEFQACPGQCGIRLPEAFIATKVGQPGIHTHASACGDDEGISRFDQLGGMGNRSGVRKRFERHGACAVQKR